MWCKCHWKDHCISNLFSFLVCCCYNLLTLLACLEKICFLSSSNHCVSGFMVQFFVQFTLVLDVINLCHSNNQHTLASLPCILDLYHYSSPGSNSSHPTLIFSMLPQSYCVDLNIHVHLIILTLHSLSFIALITIIYISCHSGHLSLSREVLSNMLRIWLPL